MKVFLQHENTLYVLCKTCKNVRSDSVLGFSFSLKNDTTFTPLEPFCHTPGYQSLLAKEGFNAFSPCEKYTE